MLPPSPRTPISACLRLSDEPCPRSVHDPSIPSPLTSTMSPLDALCFFFQVESILRLSLVSLILISHVMADALNSFLLSSQIRQLFLYSTSLLILFGQGILRIQRRHLVLNVSSFGVMVFATLQDSEPCRRTPIMFVLQRLKSSSESRHPCRTPV